MRAVFLLFWIEQVDPIYTHKRVDLEPFPVNGAGSSVQVVVLAMSGSVSA